MSATLMLINIKQGVHLLGNKATVMVQHLPITKARINLGQLARRVRANKEYFILEKDGIPVIGIMDADELGLPGAARPKGPGSHQTGHRGISSW